MINVDESEKARTGQKPLLLPDSQLMWPAAGWSKMLKTSEERERTDDFFAPSPHPESYPSQPSLSMWGGNTWQPHRGTHCHTGGSHWVQSQRYPHCGGAEDQQGHHSKANIYQGAATQIYIKHINRGTTATQIYNRQPHSPTGLHAKPAEPHKAKAHHKKSQRSKIRD